MMKMENSSKKAKELKAKFVTKTIREISEADISSREMFDILGDIASMAEELASKTAFYSLKGGEDDARQFLKDMVAEISRRYENRNEDGEDQKDTEESEDEEEGATIAEVLIGELLRSLADDISGRKSHEEE